MKVEEENESGRGREVIVGRQPEKPRSSFEILSDLNQTVPSHLADDSQTR